MNVRVYYLLFITALVAGVLGYSIGRRPNASRGSSNLLEIERAKMIGVNAEWLRRFNTAYSTQPPEVGIWEGENLLNYLTGKAAVVPAESFENDIMLTHAKLSGLYLEIGATNEAELNLSAAVGMMQKKHPGQDLAKIREGLDQFTKINRGRGNPSGSDRTKQQLRGESAGAENQ